MLVTKSVAPLVATLTCIFSTANAYSLAFTYNSGNFFNYFSFFTSADPTEGYVDYVSQSVADNTGLVNSNNGQVYLGVDYTTYNPSGGRESVRLSSDQEWGQGTNHISPFRVMSLLTLCSQVFLLPILNICLVESAVYGRLSGCLGQ